MKRRIIGYLLFLAFLLAVWFLFGAFEGEPRYQDKTVDEWRLALDFPETRAHAVDALLHLGTNQTPAIIKKLLTQDSQFKQKWFDLLNHQPWISFSFVSEENRRWDGVTALSNLGPGARAALPALTNLLGNPDLNIVYTAIEAIYVVGPTAGHTLINLLGNTNMEVRAAAVGALGRLCQQADTQDSDADGVVPRETIARAILPYFTDPNRSVRYAALNAVGQVDGLRRIIFPAFLSALTNSNFDVRGFAAYKLGSQGKDAQPAVPLLLELLHDSVPMVRESATNALMKIDPEAAAQAGIK